MKTYEKDGLLVIGAIKGLVSEGKEIEKAFRERKPDMGAVSVSPSELAGLREYIKEGEPVVELFGHEIAYLELLMEFGEVRAPSPSYMVPLKTTLDMGIPLVPLDMADDEFADAYMKHVSGVDFVSHMVIEKKVGKKAFKVRDVEDFVMQWDEAINGNKALMAVEKDRERYMGKKLAGLLKKSEKIIAVVDFERMDGILESMAKYL